VSVDPIFKKFRQKDLIPLETAASCGEAREARSKRTLSLRLS